MVGKTVCSRKIATQYQADQIILVKVEAEKFTRTIEWGGIGDHMPGLVKVGAERFTRVAERDRYKDETSSSSEGWGGEVH